MNNQYKAIGMLINDLRKERYLLTDGIVEELREHFSEILMQLAAAWYKEVPLLDYLLDFHLAEAERLRRFVVYEEGRDYPVIRAVLHEEFSLLIGRIGRMIEGKFEEVEEDA